MPALTGIKPISEPAPPSAQLEPLLALPRKPLLCAQGPLYRQIAEVFRRLIEAGSYPVESELPKEAEIAEHFGVSLITIRQALQSLEALGLIRKRSAKPAVVIADAPPVSLGWTFNNFNDMAAFTKDSELKLKSWKQEVSKPAARVFGLAPGTPCYCLRSMLTVGRQRKAQITTWFPPEIGERLRREDFSDVLIFRAVQKALNIRMEMAQCTVRAEVADESVVADLGVTLGSALLVVEMLYKDASQRIVEYSVARHPADLFSIKYDAANDLS